MIFSQFLYTQKKAFFRIHCGQRPLQVHSWLKINDLVVDIVQSLSCPREHNLLQINIVEQTSLVPSRGILKAKNADENIDRGNVMSFGHGDMERGSLPSVGIVLREGDGALPPHAGIRIVTEEITENWRGEMALVLASRTQDELPVRLDARNGLRNAAVRDIDEPQPAVVVAESSFWRIWTNRINKDILIIKGGRL